MQIRNGWKKESSDCKCYDCNSSSLEQCTTRTVEPARAADELRLDRFMRNNPHTFKGRYNPEGAQNWLQGIERIFRAMASTNEKKVRLATHMLAEEDEFWWGNAHQRLEGEGIVVTWEVFREDFLGKYFPADVRNKKELEFLELK